MGIVLQIWAWVYYNFKINSKDKEKTTKFRNISDKWLFRWVLSLFHYNVFPLRESISMLPGKGKGFTLDELFRSPFTELAFEFYYKQEFMLKVLIQIDQIFKSS